MLEGAMEGGKRAFVGELHQSRGRCGRSLEMGIIILMRARMSMVTVLKRVALTLRLRGSKTRCRRKMKKVDTSKIDRLEQSIADHVNPRKRCNGNE